MARARTRSARRTTRARGGRAARGGGIAQYLIPIGVAGALLWYLMPRAQAGTPGQPGDAGKPGGTNGGTNGGGTNGGMNGGGMNGGGMNGGGTNGGGTNGGGTNGGGTNGGGTTRPTTISQIAVPIPDFDTNIQALTYLVDDTNVNFRGAPTTSGAVLYKLNRPDRVIAPTGKERPGGEPETGGAFIGVIDPVNGQAGWVSTQFLRDPRVYVRGAEGEGLPSNRRGSSGGDAPQNLLPGARFDRFANVRAPNTAGRARVGGWGRCGR